MVSMPHDFSTAPVSSSASSAARGSGPRNVAVSRTICTGVATRAASNARSGVPATPMRISKPSDCSGAMTRVVKSSSRQGRSTGRSIVMMPGAVDSRKGRKRFRHLQQCFLRGALVAARCEAAGAGRDNAPAPGSASCPVPRPASRAALFKLNDARLGSLRFQQHQRPGPPAQARGAAWLAGGNQAQTGRRSSSSSLLPKRRRSTCTESPPPALRARRASAPRETRRPPRRANARNRSGLVASRPATSRPIFPPACAAAATRPQ